MRRLLALILLLPLLGMGGQNVMTGPSRNVFTPLPAPVGYWKLCGDTASSAACTPSNSTSVRDSSANANTGTWSGTQGGSSFYYDPATNALPYAGHFDGATNYVNVPDAVPLHVASAFTLSAVFTQAVLHDFSGIIAKTTGNLPCPFDIWVDHTGLAYFVYGNGISHGYLNFTMTTTGTPQYVDAVWDGTNVAVYLNGALQAGPSAPTSPIADCGTALKIGNRNDLANYADGMINYVQIYNVGLTGGQIASLSALQAELVYPFLHEIRSPEWAWNFERDDLNWMARKIIEKAGG